jgi:hypothetical protein
MVFLLNVFTTNAFPHGKPPVAAIQMAGPPTPNPSPRKARKVMRADARKACRSVEKSRWKLVKLPRWPYPVLVPQLNGRCVAYGPVNGSCEYSTWPATEPDENLRGHIFYVCNNRIVWQTNKDTWKGICWAELGKPRDGNALITATRFTEVGYDNRGALRIVREEWRCRAS